MKSSRNLHSVLTLLLWHACLACSAVQAVGMSEPRRFVDLLNLQDSVTDEHLQQDATSTSNARDDCDVQELFLKQRLDHFAASPEYFQQRYFYSDRFVDKSSSQDKQYAFLCVGGEGPSLTKAVLVDSVHCSGDALALAEQLHLQRGLSVHLFALEHRYYGRSYPSEFYMCPVDNGFCYQRYF